MTLKDSFQRMEHLKLLCQVRKILPPVNFRALDAFMPGHVLNLPDVICLKPVHYDTYPELPAVFYLRVDTLYSFHYLTDQIARLPGREEIWRLLVPLQKGRTGFLEESFQWQDLRCLKPERSGTALSTPWDIYFAFT